MKSEDEEWKGIHRSEKPKAPVQSWGQKVALVIITFLLASLPITIVYRLVEWLISL